MINKNYVEEGLRSFFNEAFEEIPTKDNCNIEYIDNNNAIINITVESKKGIYESVDYFIAVLLGGCLDKSSKQKDNKLAFSIKVHVPFVNWTKFEV